MRKGNTKKGSAYFDGSGDYLTLADSDDWNFGSGDFTMEFDYKFASATGGYCLISTVSGSYLGFQVLTAPTGLTFYSYNGGAATTAIYTRTEDTARHNLTIVRSSGIVTLYHDGVGNTGVSIPTTGNSAQTLQIGIDRDFSTSPLQGNIYGIRITKGTARYTANFTPPQTFENDTNTVLCMNFNETNGATTFIDDTGKTVTTYGNTVAVGKSAVYNVKVPTVSNLKDTEVYMWYGNDSAYNTSIEAWRDMTGKELTYYGNVNLGWG